MAQHAEILESAIDGATLVLSENQDLVPGGVEIESVLNEFGDVITAAVQLRVGIKSANDEICRVVAIFVLDLAVASEDAADTVLKLLTGSVYWADF